MTTTDTQSIIFATLVDHRLNGKKSRHKLDLLKPIRQWLDDIEIKNSQVARLIAKLIPTQCPFERDITLFNRKIGHIPPLCKLNPLYDQFVGLRFRALCYLADECGEDIRFYC
ncbi:Mo-dependent nitrogenase family protein [Raphidiopsis curvata NIES-932]|nr:Mo-dependent nitrogenase family protein [Raphidiopsis curvata NIES-932]